MGLKFFAMALCFVFQTSNIYAMPLTEQNISSTDSLETIKNPDIGFYEHAMLHLKESGNNAVSPNANLVHLRCDIAAFSSNAPTNAEKTAYGKTQPISDDALSVLGQTLENIKAKGHTVIVRVCYDYNYLGVSNAEPPQEMITEHIKQLGKVFSEHKDVITFIELGMYGPYGEMHTSSICTKANVSQALQTMLDNTDEELKIGVRTPAYAAHWLGLWDDKRKYFDIDSDEFWAAINAKGKDAYRVGMFNDGYLGTYNDYGTYSEIPRENGIGWLNTVCANTPYGGECVTTDNNDPINAYNTIDFLSKEAFITHTSYLNSSWNNYVIDKWKNSEKYTGEGEYNGQTAYKYIADHLGYRFILRGSRAEKAAMQGGELKISVNIENVGFGNITNTQKITYILKAEDGTVYELCPKTETDPKTLLSQQITQLDDTLVIPDEIPAGTYSLYLRISKYGDVKTDNNYRCIRFANTAAQWDSTTGSNYIGSCKVLDKGTAAEMLKYLLGGADKTELSAYTDEFDFNDDERENMLDVIAVLS